MEQTMQPEHVAVPDAKLQQAKIEPKGVIRKNLKVWIFLGASAVVLSAALVSNWTKKSSSHSSVSQHSVPQPALQDNTDNNVQDLKNQLAVERQREAQVAATRAAQANNAPPVIEQGVVTGASQAGLCTPASHANNKESMRNHNFPRKSSRRCNWRPENGNWRTTHDLHRILFIRVQVMHMRHLVRIRILLWAPRRRRR